MQRKWGMPKQWWFISMCMWIRIFCKWWQGVWRYKISRLFYVTHIYFERNSLFIRIYFFQDVDECQNMVCPDNSECINGIGSYTCQCENGYEDDGTGKCKGNCIKLCIWMWSWSRINNTYGFTSRHWWVCPQYSQLHRRSWVFKYTRVIHLQM